MRGRALGTRARGTRQATGMLLCHMDTLWLGRRQPGRPGRPGIGMIQEVRSTAVPTLFRQGRLREGVGVCACPPPLRIKAGALSRSSEPALLATNPNLGLPHPSLTGLSHRVLPATLGTIAGRYPSCKA